MNSSRVRTFSSGILVAVAFAWPDASGALEPWQPVGPWGFRSGEGFTVAPSDPSRLYAWQGDDFLRSDDGGDSWIKLQPMKEGDRGGIIVSPVDRDLVLATIRPAGFSSQIARSTDGGRNWTWIPPQGGVRSLAFHPASKGRKAYYYSSEGYFESLDEGLTWSHVANLPTHEMYGIPNYYFYSFAYHPTREDAMLAWLGQNERGTTLVYLSTDTGRTWNASNLTRTFGIQDQSHDRVVSSSRSVSWTSDPELLYATNGFDPFRSTDGGQTFHRISSVPRFYIYCLAPNPTNPLDVYACATSNNPNERIRRIFRSRDGGETWSDETSIFGIPERGGNIQIRLSHDAWYASFQSKRAVNLFRSTDEGTTWTPREARGVLRFAPEILRTDEAGQLHIRSFGGAYDEERYLVRENPHREGTFRILPSNDEPRPSGRSLSFDAHWFDSSVYLSAGVYRDGSHEGADIHSHLTVQGTDLLHRDRDLEDETVATITINYGDGESFAYWRRERPPRMFRGSRDLQGTWSLLELGEMDFFPTGAIISPGGFDEIFVISEADLTQPVFQTTDGGFTWEPRSTGLPHDRPTNLLMDPADPDHLLVGFEHKSPFETIDGGLSWKERPIDLAGERTLEVAWDPRRDEVYLSTTGGMFVEGEGFWNRDLPEDEIESIAYSPRWRTLFAATAQNSVWRLAVGKSPQPSRFEIHTPDFSSSPSVATSRSFEAPPAHRGAQVSIFDVQGRLVRTFEAADDRHPRDLWDGRTQSRSRAAPGVYFLRVVSGTEMSVRKVVVTR